MREIIQQVMDDYCDETNVGEGEDKENGLAARIVRALNEYVSNKETM